MASQCPQTNLQAPQFRKPLGLVPVYLNPAYLLFQNPKRHALPFPNRALPLSPPDYVRAVLSLWAYYFSFISIPLDLLLVFSYETPPGPTKNPSTSSFI